MEIYVFVRFQAQPGKADALEEALGRSFPLHGKRKAV